MKKYSPGAGKPGAVFGCMSGLYVAENAEACRNPLSKFDERFLLTFRPEQDKIITSEAHRTIFFRDAFEHLKRDDPFSTPRLRGEKFPLFLQLNIVTSREPLMMYDRKIMRTFAAAKMSKHSFYGQQKVMLYQSTKKRNML